MPTVVQPASEAPEQRTTRVPAFVPHPWLRGGHAQTVLGRYLPGLRGRLPATREEIAVSGGDRLVLLDSVPTGWQPGGPAVVVVHGLCGCATSPFVVRLALRLTRLGARVVRVNLRGAGDGLGLARQTYHSGRTEDIRAVVDWLADRAPASPIALVGFSLGANLVLKLAAEAVEVPLPGFDCVLAANPPLDLSGCSRQIQRRDNRMYDRNFLRLLRTQVAQLHARFPDLGPVDLSQAKSLYDFDDLYTAPRNGFAGAEDYYQKCSAGPRIPQITAPGLVVHARDDPFIPPEPFERVVFPPQLALELIPYGGHLGYVSRDRWQGDHRWLETRLAVWLADFWQSRGLVSAAAETPRR